MSKPAVSQHLSVLVHYSLVPDHLANTLNAHAQEVCPVSKPLKAESAAIAARKPRKG